MMKAVELCGKSAPPESEVTSLLECNAKAFGYPTEISEAVLNSFENNASSFMTTNFKTSLPVSCLFDILVSDESLAGSFKPKVV